MDHHPSRAHPLGHPAGRQDIACGLFLAVRVWVGGVDEVGGVKGQDDPRRPGVLSDGPGCGLPHGHAFPALVFVGVQALFLQPAGHILGVLEALGSKAVRVAGGAEESLQSSSPLAARRRNGVSTLYRRKRKAVPNWMGRTIRVRTPALLPPHISVKI